MMTRIATLLVAGCLLLLAAAASADRRIVEELERSYELVLSETTLPRDAAGSIVFKECETCAIRSVRVNSDTTYFVNEAQVPFDDFARLAQDIEARGGDADTGVYVHYDIKTLRVNRVRVVEFGRR